MEIAPLRLDLDAGLHCGWMVAGDARDGRECAELPLCH
jgi:hypothetical protein